MRKGLQTRLSVYILIVYVDADSIYSYNLCVMSSRELLCAMRSSPDFLTSSFVAPQLNCLRLTVGKGGGGGGGLAE